MSMPLTYCYLDPHVPVCHNRDGVHSNSRRVCDSAPEDEGQVLPVPGCVLYSVLSDFTVPSDGGWVLLIHTHGSFVRIVPTALLGIFLCTRHWHYLW